MYPQLLPYKGIYMPTYNYYCSDCDTHFSYFQKMSESPISNCENCCGKIKRLITAGTGLIFKGSGYYQTDYKNKEKDDSSLDGKEKKPKKEKKSPEKKSTDKKVKVE